MQARPRTVLLEVIDALTAKKIEIPTYNVLANLVVAAMEEHQEGLSDIVDVCLTESQRQKLDALLSQAPVDGAEDGWRYRLTLLKKPLQSTKPRKIKATLKDQQALQTLYLDLQPVIARLNLSYGSIRYYAYSVIKSQIPQVSRRFAAARYLHLIAFVIYQTYKLNDTLVDILLHSVQATLNTVDKELRETFFDDREQRQSSISSLVDSLRQNVRSTHLAFFFPERKYIPLLEALATVDQATQFLGEFEHWQIKYRRAKPAAKIFFAGIMGYGCDIGHRKLAQISK